MYAERFGVEPHQVNPPLRWWLRLQAYDTARSQRTARETVERVGLAKSDAATQKAYDALMIALRFPDGG